MGCDIHAGIEFKPRNSKDWVALLFPNKYLKYSSEEEPEPALAPTLDLGRDYDMFAILGDVRNGSGFAGVLTGDGFHPMSSQRGVPDDVTAEVRDHTLSNEHSPTWVTLAEILAYDWRRTTKHYGVVNAKTFEEWDRMKQWHPQPKSWSGDITGPQIVHVHPDQMRAHIKEVFGDKHFELARGKGQTIKPQLYTRICWELTYAVSGRQIWEKILPHMLPLGQEHGFENVRLVMDFDS